MILQLLLIAWLTLGVGSYVVLLYGAFRARKTGRSGYGWLAVLMAPLLVVVAPVLVLRAYLRTRQARSTRDSRGLLATHTTGGNAGHGRVPRQPAAEKRSTRRR